MRASLIVPDDRWSAAINRSCGGRGPSFGAAAEHPPPYRQIRVGRNTLAAHSEFRAASATSSKQGCEQVTADLFEWLPSGLPRLSIIASNCERSSRLFVAPGRWRQRWLCPLSCAGPSKTPTDGGLKRPAAADLCRLRTAPGVRLGYDVRHLTARILRLGGASTPLRQAGIGDKTWGSTPVGTRGRRASDTPKIGL